MSALSIIEAVNALLQLSLSVGISWQQLKLQIDKAHAEGRVFGLADLEVLQGEAEASLTRLREAIDKARNP